MDAPSQEMCINPVQFTMVDAFTETPFMGNPAVVCWLEEEKDKEWLQTVAREFNIPVTCYLTRVLDMETVDSADKTTSNPHFSLRWFSPVTEVKLCGHATLAAAHAVFSSGMLDSDVIEFTTLSGILTAKRLPEADPYSCFSKICNGDASSPSSIELDFPVIQISEYDSKQTLWIAKACNGASIVEIKKTAADDLLLVLPSAKDVEDVKPQFDEIQGCPVRGIIITGAADSHSKFDFVSRFFYPKLGVNEDVICGSAHCALAPYWSKKLGKNDFVAYAASARGGVMKVHLDEQTQRVKLSGKAVTVTKGSLFV